jgi:hypothetical protein
MSVCPQHYLGGVMLRIVRCLRYCSLNQLTICCLFLVFLPLSTATATTEKPSSSTADHRKFEELQQQFESAPEVTKACLGCHTEASKQIHKTLHWNWKFTHPDTGQVLGKKKIVNSFCGSITTNYARCTSCHIGYGWKDDSFDFTSEVNVDCLVCHDATDTYRKFPTDAGHPAYIDKPFPPKKAKSGRHQTSHRSLKMLVNPVEKTAAIATFWVVVVMESNMVIWIHPCTTPRKSWMCTWVWTV